MAALIQFVDSIGAAPTVRLDVNDGMSWFCQSFKAPPPRLRRSVSANSMGDGDYVSSSSYENRTLELELTLIEDGDEEFAAQEMQKLWRELDRANNWLMYLPDGLDKPVFFRLFRSDVSDLEELWTTPIARNITLELLAESHALGVMETLGPYVVNNDPAAATNPGYVDISGVLGDVATEAIFWNTTYNRAATVMGIRHGEFSEIRPSIQAESMQLGISTTNPGGGPDADMSGTGTNNFARTSFASAGLSVRLTGTVNTLPSSQWGSWAIYAAVRRSDNTSVIRVGLGASNPSSASMTTLPLSTERQLVRLGSHSTVAGENYVTRILTANSFNVWAERTSGAGTLDWDCVFLIPADSALLEARNVIGIGSAVADDVFDGVADRAFRIATGGNPVILAADLGLLKTSGRIPQLVPNVTSRLHYLTSAAYDSTGLRTHDKTETNSLTVYYWPKHLFVRAAS